MAALTDKRALITGGASGLGLAIAIDGHPFGDVLARQQLAPPPQSARHFAPRHGGGLFGRDCAAQSDGLVDRRQRGDAIPRAQ